MKRKERKHLGCRLEKTERSSALKLCTISVYILRELSIRLHAKLIVVSI